MEEKRPFPCNAKGCSKSFNTEHHLKVHTTHFHTQKHENMLNLEIPDKNIYSDQTPTPTRLIKNCEEVGLFEDLQHVNPFDETFRNACIEPSKNEPVLNNNGHISDLYGEELHTPQIYPQFQTASKAISREPLLLRPSSFEEEVIKNIPKKRKYQEQVSLPKRSPKASMLSVELPTIAVTTPSESPPELRSKCFDKIKELVLRKQQGGLPPTEVVSKPTVVTPAPVKPKDKTKDAGSNREAARRYRQKMKKSHTELTQKTAQLEEENFRLKKELRFLKEMALTCTCGSFRDPPPNADILNSDRKDIISQISENNVSDLVPRKVSEKYKPILPAPPVAQQPQLMLAGTLHNYKNMTPVYLVLTTTGGDDQSKS